MKEVIFAVHRAKIYVRRHWRGDIEFESEALFAVALSIAKPRTDYSYFQASTYLYVKYACLNLFRQQLEIRKQEANIRDKLAKVRHDERIEAVREALSKLLPEDVDLVERRFLKDQTFDEISTAYKCSSATAFNRLHKVLVRLRNELEHAV